MTGPSGAVATTRTNGPPRATRSLVVGQVRTGAAVVSAALGALVAIVVTSYTSFELGDATLTELTDNPALRALFGIPYSVATAGGFTVWRAGSFVLLITGLWSLRTATRILRGEEEAGRWDLVLAGPQQAAAVLRTHLAVLAAAVALPGVAVAGAFVATGEAVTGAVLYGTAVALVGLTFAALGALSSQLFEDRRRATGVGGAVLGATFAVRMLADGSAGLGWLRWGSPFGWAEEVQAFAADRPGPLVPLALAPLVLGAAALALARRRDLGAGLVRTSRAGPARTRLLGDLVGLAWRQRLGGVAGWVGGAAFFGLMLGGVTGSFTEFIAGDAYLLTTMSSLGFGALTTPAGFVGTLLSFAGVLISVAAVLVIQTLWEDEEQGRAELVLSQPRTRTAWLGAHVVAAAALVVSATLACGVGTWAGVVLSGQGLAAGDAIGGALNTLPLAVVYLGLAVLLLGVRPEVGTAVAVAAVAVGFLLDLLGPALDVPAWLIDTSPFAHLADVPAVAFDPRSTVALLGVGLALGVAGALTYARRDLR